MALIVFTFVKMLSFSCMNIYKLLTFHAIITLAAAIVLVVAPSFIPKTVDIEIQHGQFLLCYFLAAAEFALAYLSFYSRKINDRAIMRLITITIIIFHASTFLLELFALSNGLSTKIIANIVARVIIIVLFYYYGIVRLTKIQA